MRFRYKDTGKPRGRGALNLDDYDNADTDPSVIPQLRGVPSDVFSLAMVRPAQPTVIAR